MDHEPAYTNPFPLPWGFYHMVISGCLDHQSTQFRLSASELLLFVSVVLVLINALCGIAMALSLRNSFIMTKNKKQKKAISICCFCFCLNSLMCCSFPFHFVLNVSLLLGTADAEILRSPVKNPELINVFLKSTE